MIPRIVIRIENLSAIVVAGYLYFQINDVTYLNLSRWYLIFLIWLSFDLSLIGFLVNKKLGSYIYNLVHNYILAFILILIGFRWYNPDVIAVALILVIHVGIDRFLGFGLKYPSGFKNTHMQKI